MNSTTIGRNPGLDTLRALAIVLVFANHYMIFVSGAPTFGWVSEIGWAGVDLFFALSGYLIGNQILAGIRKQQAGTARFSLARFYARRLLRTLPNFYFVLALYALWPAMRGSSELPPLWKFLTFTQNINLMPGTAFSHAWSLCVEEQFYFLLPASALLIATLRKSLLWAWVAAVGAVLGGMLLRSQLWPGEYGNGHYYTVIYYASWCRFDELIFGVALALLRNYHAAAWTRITSYGNWTLVAGVVLLTLTWRALLDDHYGYTMTVYGYPLLGLSYSLLLIAALSPGSLLQRWRVPGAASIALWSYAIYLTHKQLCVLLRAPLAEQGWEAESWQALLIMSAASALAGWLLYRLVETPFMKLRDRYVASNYASSSQSHQTATGLSPERP
ncbi:acyltransferase family protein [Duganella sp. FT80W]|uniref:Acyltransferase family protein n=1 Tax=Duganella guangzhouensis TaxID=2666084 RepID=A0A6I2KTM5_9BURK|nr:acyltransferase [Duganella guangzhouensis]MRW88742.1 acyltransferase family protein [Duganella guangzhouensis]